MLLRGQAPLPTQVFRCQTEVEQDDSIVPGHEHVGRLDVAVQRAGLMQRRHRLGELHERGAQSYQLAVRQGGRHNFPAVRAPFIRGRQLHVPGAGGRGSRLQRGWVRFGNVSLGCAVGGMLFRHDPDLFR